MAEAEEVVELTPDQTPGSAGARARGEIVGGVDPQTGRWSPVIEGPVPYRSGGNEPLGPQGPLAPYTRPDIQEQIDKSEKIQREEEASHRRYETKMAPLRRQEERLLSSPHPAMPQMQPLGKPPDQRDYQKHALEFASAMTLIGAFSGRLARAPAGASMQAFAAGIQGWNEGNQQRYENATKQWEQGVKATIENNRQSLEKYDLLLKDRSLSVSELSERMKLAAVERYDDQMYHAAQQQNVALMGRLRDMQWESTFGEKGLQNVIRPYLADISRQRLYDFRLAESFAPLAQNNWIDPRTGQEALDPQTNKPFTDAQKRYVEEQVKKYPPGTPLSALGIPGLDDQGTKGGAEFQIWRQQHPGGTIEEYWRSKALSRPPRNAPAMYMQKWMEEHPEAGSKDIRQAMAIYNMTQSKMRALGTREAGVSVAIREAVGTGDLAMTASANVPRGDFVPINEIKEKIRRGTSSVAQQNFDQANAALITAYAQTMSRTGATTVHSQQRAEAVLNTAVSHEAYVAGVRQLQREMKIVQDAVKDVEREASGEEEGSGAGGRDPAFAGKSDAEVLEAAGLGSK